MNQLNLIKIHKRRKALLEVQKAKSGAQHNVTIDMEIEDINSQIQELEFDLKRILQSLKEKQAIYGISTDPSVLINIENIEEYFKNVLSCTAVDD